MTKPVLAVLGGAVLIGAGLVAGLFIRPAHDAGLLEHTTEVQSDGTRIEMWSDPSDGRQRTVMVSPRRSAHIEMVTSAAAGTFTVALVDYHERSWTSDTQNGPESPTEVPTQAVLAQSMHRQVTSGRFHVVGRGVVAGRQALHLHARYAGPGNPQFPPLTVDEWVDASSYVPLLVHTSTPDSRSVVTYRWVPRTVANAARLQLIVPHGFRHLHGSKLTAAWISASASRP